MEGKIANNNENKIQTVKRVSRDFIYNILAAVASSGVLQLIVYPVLGASLTNEKYGTLLTAVGLMNTVALAFGNTLNNIRLIQNYDYDQKKIKGDFNPLLSIVSAISFFFLAIFGAVFLNFSLVEFGVLSITGLIATVRAYGVVTYRIVLDFKKNFYCNIVIALGYGLGLIIFIITGLWPVVFLLGEIAGVMYLSFTSLIFREPFKMTPLFSGTLSKYLVLLLSGLSSSAMMYLDRWILYPVIGGAAVSTFTVASFFGKSLGIVLTPISGVLLSYYASKNFKMDNKRFWMINIIVLAICSIFLVVSIPISPYITGILYPTIVDNALDYIFIANAAALISLAVSMTQPAILKYLPVYWQVIKELIYVIVYFILGIILLKKYGLWGFCIATIVANLVKLCVLYVIGTIHFQLTDKSFEKAL